MLIVFSFAAGGLFQVPLSLLAPRSFNVRKPTTQGRDGSWGRVIIFTLPLHSSGRPRKQLQLFVHAGKLFARRSVPGAAARPGREHGAAAVHPASRHRCSGCQGHRAGVHTGEAGERVLLPPVRQNRTRIRFTSTLLTGKIGKINRQQRMVVSALVDVFRVQSRVAEAFSSYLAFFFVCLRFHAARLSPVDHRRGFDMEVRHRSCR